MDAIIHLVETNFQTWLNPIILVFEQQAINDAKDFVVHRGYDNIIVRTATRKFRSRILEEVQCIQPILNSPIAAASLNTVFTI